MARGAESVCCHVLHQVLTQMNLLGLQSSAFTNLSDQQPALAISAQICG